MECGSPHGLSSSPRISIISGTTGADIAGPPVGSRDDIRQREALAQVNIDAFRDSVGWFGYVAFNAHRQCDPVTKSNDQSRLTLLRRRPTDCQARPDAQFVT